jgi:CheY-like chemotaxis protein
MLPNTKAVEILIVEDDDIDAKGIYRAMNKLKIANPTRRVKDGIEALRLLRQEGDEFINRPYVILLDINMPRMNGLELLEEIRADDELKDSIVFVLTTSRAQEDRIAAFKYNVAGYMVKSNLEEGFMSALKLIDHYWRIVELPG